jgi:hypothetical protein
MTRARYTGPRKDAGSSVHRCARSRTSRKDRTSHPCEPRHRSRRFGGRGAYGRSVVRWIAGRPRPRVCIRVWCVVSPHVDDVRTRWWNGIELCEKAAEKFGRYACAVNTADSTHAPTSSPHDPMHTRVGTRVRDSPLLRDSCGVLFQARVGAVFNNCCSRGQSSPPHAEVGQFCSVPHRSTALCSCVRAECVDVVGWLCLLVPPLSKAKCRTEACTRGTATSVSRSIRARSRPMQRSR